MADALSDTYLKAKRYLVFFAAILALTSAVGLSPSAENSVLGWSVGNPSNTSYVLYIVVLYYLGQLALFWDAQGRQIKELEQHAVDYRLSVSIGLASLYSLPIFILMHHFGLVVVGGAQQSTPHWITTALLLAAPPLGWLAYAWIFRPKIAKSRDDAARREGDVLAVLTSHTWRLIYNPIVYQQTNGQQGSKEITFGLDGEIEAGRNVNEHNWRISSGFLELLNREGRVFSRFRYERESQRFLNTNDPDLLSIRDQTIVQTGQLIRPDFIGPKPSRPG